jgi:hypothetical protein
VARDRPEGLDNVAGRRIDGLGSINDVGSGDSDSVGDMDDVLARSDIDSVGTLGTSDGDGLHVLNSLGGLDDMLRRSLGDGLDIVHSVSFVDSLDVVDSVLDGGLGHSCSLLNGLSGGLGNSVHNVVNLRGTSGGLLVLNNRGRLLVLNNRGRLLVLDNRGRLLVLDDRRSLVGNVLGRLGGRSRSRGLVVGHPRHLGLVNIGVINLDGMVVLVVLAHVGVNTNFSAIAEVDTIIFTGRTAHSSATAGSTIFGARGVGTLKRSHTTLRDHGTGPTERREGSRMDILVLDIDGVVISVALLDGSLGIDCDRHVELLATVIAGGTTHDSATALGFPASLGLPTTLEGSTESRRTEMNMGRRGVDVGVFDVDGVVIVAVLIHLGVEVGVNAIVEVDTIVLARRTAYGSTTSLDGGMEALRFIGGRITTGGTTNNGAALLVSSPALLESRTGKVVVLRNTFLGLTEARTRGAREDGRRVRDRGVNRRSVDVLILQLDGVVVLGLLVNAGVEIACDGHVEDLALVISRGATDDGAALRPAALAADLGEGTHAGSHGNTVGHRSRWGRIDILVLDVDRVVILARLLYIAVSVDVGTHRSETTIVISTRGATYNGGSDVSMGHNTTSMNAVLGVLHSLGSNCQQGDGNSTDKALHCDDCKDRIITGDEKVGP